MPTASTAQILGNNEAFEPFTSNIYVRRVLAGEFVYVNRHLVRALTDRGLWTPDVRDMIVAANGSVQHIECIPPEVRRVFKTVWEMKMKNIIDMAADRGVFVDQSQSLNLFVAEPTHKKLSSMHFHAWKRGLKTGMYYLRTRPAVEAVNVSVPVEVEEKVARKQECIMCSS
jgi:ribonucleoside-diphosphate reductase alpha chain